MDFKSLLPFGRNAAPAANGDVDPFTALQREINRAFDDVWHNYRMPAMFGGDGTLAPKIDIKETEAGLQVTAELPGVDEKDIAVELDGDRLSIKGEKKMEKDEAQKGYHLKERSYGMFQRILPLPFAPRAEEVQAQFAKGVLTVTLKRPPEAAAKVKKIDVQAA